MKIKIGVFGPCDCEVACEKCQGDNAYKGEREIEVSRFQWFLWTYLWWDHNLPRLTDPFGGRYVGIREGA